MTLPVNARNIAVVLSVDDEAARRLTSGLAQVSNGQALLPFDADPAEPGAVAPYDAFLDRHQVSAAALRREAPQVLTRFLAELLAETPADALVFLAVPLGALFEMGAAPDDGLPRLLTALRALDVSLVQVQRRDPLHLAIRLMQQAGRAEGLASGKIRLEPDRVFRLARRLAARQDHLGTLLSELDARAIRVPNDELLGTYCAANLRRIFRLMGRYVVVDAGAVLAETGPDAPHAVVNLEEILDIAMRAAPELIAGLASGR